ncbi:MAG TPA: hypothetical protein VFB78_07125 [Acidimicrobiales bacterium]|nr:hypothetical protein [Acidimicrobiales bacterium]
MTRRRGLAVLALTVSLLAAGTHASRAADDYTNSAYMQHDLDNMSRSSVRQRKMVTDPDYHLAFMKAAGYSWIDAQRNQLADLNVGRIHLSLGQLLPGGSVGDPQRYFDITPTRIQFLSRTGAKLSGRIWSNGTPGPRPGIVITTGSLQGTEHMYWWAARTLAGSGYVVMTFDVQGQGESETTGHAFGDVTPTTDGVPFQQAANFYDGTIDALRFFMSTPSAAYVPGGRTPAEVATAKSAATRGHEHLDWVNPLWGSFDRARIGIAGHSLGAGAVSAVQQCSDKAVLWKTLALCGGRSFPIRAVIGWDALSADVTPVVPGMNQQADGYFLNPEPAYTAPAADGHLEAHRKWKSAGLDTYSLTIRGGTHLEWAQIPWILPATGYGTSLADYYTLAWFDRYVKGSAAAAARLLNGPRDLASPGNPWNAHHFSTRYLSAFRLGGTERIDLRQYAGLSKVGDWAGSNADRVGRAIP